jgi:hypothetical protein
LADPWHIRGSGVAEGLITVIAGGGGPANREAVAALREKHPADFSGL